MAASTLQMHVFPLPDKISTTFQRLYTYFFGSSIPMWLMRILCDQTGSGKIQDGGLWTSNACISAPRQDINDILTAISVFSGSSFPLGLIKILWDQTGSGKIQDGDLSTSIACLCAHRQEINGFSTAIVTFLRSSIPLEFVRMMCDQTGCGKHRMFRKCETAWLVFW